MLAFSALVANNKGRNNEAPLLRRLAAQDCTPLEAVVRKLTQQVQLRLGRDIMVVPRGLFASRNVLRGYADLDVDLVNPDTFNVPVPPFNRMPPSEVPIRDALGVDNWD